MHSNCTVCGVKLNNKNRVEYRPNSCRDCELERKRLYSLKRKDDNAKRSTASAKVKSGKSSKKVSVKKVVDKKTSTKLSPAKKAQLVAKDKKAKSKNRDYDIVISNYQDIINKNINNDIENFINNLTFEIYD